MKYFFLLLALLGCIYLPPPYNCIGWCAIGIQIGWFARAALVYYRYPHER